TCAIRSVIVTTKNCQTFSSPYSNLGYERHEVIGHPLWVFPNFSRLVSTNRVEVAHALTIIKKLCATHFISSANISDDFFNEEFCFSIGVCTASSRVFLIYRQVLGCPIHCGRAGEDDVLYRKLLHHL
ncbi:hypothetical protein EGW08_018105, partial [Elysia chlorotica]